jgi:hypothetical protein
MTTPMTPAFHFLHYWTHWSEPVAFTFTRLPVLGDESVVAGDRVVETTRWRQERKCELCGKQQSRFV